MEMHFSVQKKQYCFLFSENHYLNFREPYLKVLLLLLEAIFFDLSDISVNGSSFSV